MQQSHAEFNVSTTVQSPAVSRSLKITALYRVSGRHRRECRVPFIRMSGKWLAALGFNSDSHVVVHGEPGRLTLTLLSNNRAAPSGAG